MKNKTKGLIIDLCALVLWIVAFVSLGLNAYFLMGEIIGETILFCLLGAIINYMLCVAFHEAGHVVFAKAKRMKVARVNFGIFSVDYSASNKIKLFTLFGENAGESNFLPTKKFDEQTVKSVAFGGLFFNTLYLLGVLAVILLVKNPVIFCLFGVGGVPAGYLLMINALPFDKTSDGAIVFSKNGYARSIATIGEMQRNIYSGEPVVFAEHVKTSTQPLEVYCDFLRLAKTDVTACQNRIKALEKNFDFTSQEYDVIFPEILFNACIGGFLTQELKNRAENFYSQDAKTIAELRAHYAYRKHRGETDWATAILSSYQTALKNATEFEKQIENNLFALIK